MEWALLSHDVSLQILMESNPQPSGSWIFPWNFSWISGYSISFLFNSVEFRGASFWVRQKFEFFFLLGFFLTLLLVWLRGGWFGSFDGLLELLEFWVLIVEQGLWILCSNCFEDRICLFAEKICEKKDGIPVLIHFLFIFLWP